MSIECEKKARKYGKSINLSYDSKALKMWPRSELELKDKCCVHCARLEKMKEYDKKSDEKVIEPKKPIKKSNSRIIPDDEYEKMLKDNGLTEGEIRMVMNNVRIRRAR